MSELSLRLANRVRGIEWSNGAEDGTEFYAVELFGEAGELLNVIKKLERERLGMVGSRATLQDLADELADVVICIDLLAMAYDLPVVSAIIDVDQRSSLSKAIALARAVGYVMAEVEAVERHNGHVRDVLIHEPLLESMAELFGTAVVLAEEYKIDLTGAVISKFNKTSAKYGLTTRMAEDAGIY